MANPIPKSDKQIAMVMDLNKCIGCQTCTVACKQLWSDDPGMEYMWFNTVNTVPGQGTPKDWNKLGGGWKDGEVVYGKIPEEKDYGAAWEFNFDAVFNGGQGQKTHLKPEGKRPEWGPNWDEDQGAGEFPNGYYFYMPRICNHCEEPSCLAACPTQSIFKRKEDGVVLINEDTCKNMRLCQAACPYKKIYHNRELTVSQKCISCFPRLEEGVAPACVRQCPGRSRHFGFINDKNSSVYRLVKEFKVALPLYPQFGTKPMVFYIPPLLPAPLKDNGEIDYEKSRVPLSMLEEMFGQGVKDALDTIYRERKKKAAGKKSELMDILISKKFDDMLGGFDQSPAKKKNT